ncbi:cation efflux protein [Backusella circina FSU 941]|nr:cation efflux protein [Backusella circina FSU 941]
MLEHSSKRGMQITWTGFVANIGLTVSKGTAGWMMNSAALLADAAHSFSDLLGDLVTLYTFKMSRKVPDSIYPYGYGKFETFGSLSVSALLIAGGLGIGLHSFDLLLATLPQHVALSDAATAAVTTSAENNAIMSPLSSEALDPNAAWFALGSVLIKEWLYRATLKVGISERSDVLVANAWHHRSDAYSSLVALVAIGGSFAGVPIFDPLGGIIVSGMILKSGTDIMTKSTKELMDKSIEESELDEIRDIISAVKNKEVDLLDFHSIRGRKFGPFHHLDLVLRLNPNLSLTRAHDLEQRVRVAIKNQCSYVQEVIIHIDTENQPRHF